VLLTTFARLNSLLHLGGSLPPPYCPTLPHVFAVEIEASCITLNIDQRNMHRFQTHALLYVRVCVVCVGLFVFVSVLICMFFVISWIRYWTRTGSPESVVLPSFHSGLAIYVHLSLLATGTEF